MATKITNVYVKNRAAGETSFTEVDSVYTGGTQVFKKDNWISATTPMGIIPLKYLSPGSTGPYGGYRALCTQEEMNALISSCYGFLLTPMSYLGGLYVPQVSPSNNISVTIITRPSPGKTSGYKYSLPTSGQDSSKEWLVTRKDLTDKGDPIYTPTLSTTLYKIQHDKFSDNPNLGQYCYLCNKKSPTPWNNILEISIKYTWLAGSTSGGSTITVKSHNRRAPSSIRNSDYGTALSGSSNLYVN